MISETGMQQQFCLRWNNHKTNLLTVLGEQFRNEYFTDVTLACEGGSFIKCHKMVLAACSSYFQCLFSELQCRHPVVVLKDVRYAEIQAILEYMYKGEVSITQEEVEPLLKVAEALKVKGLVGENNYKSRSPPNEYNAISTSSAYGGPPGSQPHQQSPPQHLRRHSTANDQPVGTPRTSTPSPDDLSNSGGAGSSGNHGGGRDTSSTSSSEASRENAGGAMVAVKMESNENSSPPHSTGIHPALHPRSTPYPYGRNGSMPDKSTSGPLSLPIWPIAGLPINTPHTTQSIANSMFGYEAVFAAAGNTEVMSPLRRKKLSSFYSSRDTPILRTVLGQGQADSSQPMSLVCHNDGQDQMPQSNGPTTPQDGSYSMEVSVSYFRFFLCLLRGLLSLSVLFLSSKLLITPRMTQNDGLNYNESRFQNEYTTFLDFNFIPGCWLASKIRKDRLSRIANKIRINETTEKYWPIFSLMSITKGTRQWFLSIKRIRL